MKVNSLKGPFWLSFGEEIGVKGVSLWLLQIVQTKASWLTLAGGIKWGKRNLGDSQVRVI